MKNRNKIPVGLFIFVFLFFTLVSVIITAANFYLETRSGIEKIETYTKNFSIPLAEAFANIAELSYKDKDFSRLKKIFREKIQANVIDEAFFVLSNGTIVVHSDRKREEELKGNIATDEFAYNIDLIMLPIWTKTDQVQFLDYHIYDNSKIIPYNKVITRYLKRYLYKKIDILGWLVTRSVNNKGKGVGCVSFLISKEKIYESVTENYKINLRYAIFLTGVSILISFVTTIIVYVKNSGSKKQAKNKPILPGNDIQAVKTANRNLKKLKEPIKIKPKSIENTNIPDNRKIKDAILVRQK